MELPGSRTSLVLASAAALALLTGCGQAEPRVTHAAAGSSSASPHAPPSATTLAPTPPAASGGAVAPATSAAVGGGGVTPPPPGRGGLTSGGASAPAAGALPTPARPITVGPGPRLGATARGEVREHLREWEAGDLRALDPLDVRLAGDGLTASRELVAFYSRREGGRLLLRVDLLDLRYGAELGGLDLVVLIGWSGAVATRPPLGLRETSAVGFGAALVFEDASTLRLEGPGGASALSAPAGGLEVALRADLDAIELALDEAALAGLGWSGQPLTFQVLTVRDGQGRAEDALLELDLLDRSLDQAARESWVAGRQAVVAPVVIGNRAALDASTLADLVHSTRTTTSEGHVTGLHRTLESHRAHGLPLTVHLTGVLTNAIGWARTSDPRQDGGAFLRELAGFFDGDPTNGEGDFLPGPYVDNVLPYFEGAANRRFVELGAEVARERLGVSAPGPVFWCPERVIRGSTLAELRAWGFTHTVLDPEHLERWFGVSAPGGGLHRVGGVDCFVIDTTVSPFATEDGGPSLALRRRLIERALDPNPEQAVVLVADWEEFAGHKGSSSIPDAYDRVLEWLAQRPWIEVAGLQELAARGWTPVADHGAASGLPVETHAWLRHACEESYDHWYYGHPLEASLAALRPPLRYGRPHARTIGDVHTAGTLLGDAWAAVQAAPPGALRDLAAQVFASCLYRTAWHREDNHDTTRLTSGAYVSPDTSYDELSGFSYALATHAGEAALVAEAARWAAAPPVSPIAEARDIDLDGEPEYLLADERLLLVCERDGGRLVAGFARDAASGEGYQVIGSPLAYPSPSPEVAWEDDFLGAARNSALKDVWASGLGKGWVNDQGVAAVSTSAVGLVFRSSDDARTKELTWRAPGEVEVRYALDPAAGTLYVRAGLSPNLQALALDGPGGLVEQDQGGVYTLSETFGGNTVSVRIGYADAGHDARRNARAGDGTDASPRNTAFEHLVELEGDAPGFSFSVGVDVR